MLFRHTRERRKYTPLTEHRAHDESRRGYKPRRTLLSVIRVATTRTHVSRGAGTQHGSACTVFWHPWPQRVPQSKNDACVCVWRLLSVLIFAATAVSSREPNNLPYTKSTAGVVTRGYRGAAPSLPPPPLPSSPLQISPTTADATMSTQPNKHKKSSSREPEI